MSYSRTLFGENYRFDSIKQVLAEANEEKSGDRMAGLTSNSLTRRIAAKYVLADLTLAQLFNEPVVPYEDDEVTRVIIEGVDPEAYHRIKSFTVGEFRDFLLKSSEEDIAAIRDGLTSEMIAAVTKLMSNMDLVYTASKLHVTATCNTTIGMPGTLSVRLQPNHPTDSLEGILASVKEGIRYGSGDAVIGVNPSTDGVQKVYHILSGLNQFIKQHQIPTQCCVLAHVTTQMQALKMGAPVDLMFQSIAGSEISNREFGINVALLDEAYALMKDMKSSIGNNYMYFETGQGSALSSLGHYGSDQLTMEARAYGLAKRYNPFLVNTVVGFIGPEYLYDARQITRAGLEDHFMGKLTGLPMGVDVCYTNHADSDMNDNENLAMLLAMAGCNFIMGVPTTDDIMLMYQSTSFHDGAALREMLGKRPILPFERRMEELGFLQKGKLTRGDHTSLLTEHDYQGATHARINVGHAGARLRTETNLKLRADHSIAQDAVWNDSDCPVVDQLGFFRTHTLVSNKEEYLRRPDKARCFSEEEILRIRESCKENIDIQVLAADGLSPVAIEANIEETYSLIQEACLERGYSFGDPIFIKYGRVATMDKIASALNAKVTLLFIGERPGLATNESMSCYMAYDSSPLKPESQRNVVSNIYRSGMPVEDAVKEIMDLVEKMFLYKLSGTELNKILMKK